MGLEPENRCYLSITELSARSGLSVSTLHRLKKAGKIPCLQPAGKGGRLLFPADAIEQSSETAATTDATTFTGVQTRVRTPLRAASFVDATLTLTNPKRYRIMPRQPNETPIACQFFTWRLLRRNGVFYADGRGGRFHLGKHSLGTRDRDEAAVRLRQLNTTRPQT